MSRFRTTLFSRLLAGTAFLWLASASAVRANQLEQLLADGQIRVDIAQLTAGPVIARQQLNFEIRIYSPIELDGDTTIAYRSIADAVTVESNSNPDVIANDDGFIHSRVFSLYPLRGGSFQLPALEVQLALQRPDSETLMQARIWTQPLRYKVSLPAELAQDDDYTVTPRLSVTDDIEIPENGELAIGDAIERNLYLIAQGTPAVLLPEFDLSTPEGVKLYQSSPEISDIYKPRDKVNETHKEQQLTYIFEQPGTFRLPAMTFVWWDSKNGERKLIELAEHRLVVAAQGSSANTSGEGDAAGDTLDLLAPFGQLNWRYPLLAVLIAMLIQQLLKHRQALLKRYHHANRSEQKRLRAKYLQQLQQQHFGNAVECLYRASDNSFQPVLKQALTGEPELAAVLDQLMVKAFGTGESALEIDLGQAGRLFDHLANPAKPALGRQRFRFTLPLNGAG